MSFPTFLLRRMASASVLQKLSQRARDAEEMIGQLKQQIELVKQTAGTVGPAKSDSDFMF